MREPFHLTDPMRSDDPLTAALAYAKTGLRVLAIWGIDDSGACKCGDEHCDTPGKHPIGNLFPRAVHSATTNPAVIRRAWKRYPTANVAIATDDRLLVVDIDAGVGEDAVEQLNLPKTIAAKTGRGRHLYFELAPGTRLPDGLPKVDLLTGTGHYVMAPPSLHVSGENYRWRRGAKEAAELSGRIGPSNKASRVSFPTTGSNFTEGGRNDGLTSIAGTLRRRGLSRDLIEEVLLTINASECKPPLGAGEVRRIAASVGRYETASEELFGPPVQREALPMEWLWFPYIPRYGLTILAGDPGVGKSLLTALLLAIVTSSASWPLLKERPTGNRVLLLSAEDNWARVTLHRLLKAGANIVIRRASLTP